MILYLMIVFGFVYRKIRKVLLNQTPFVCVVFKSNIFRLRLFSYVRQMQLIFCSGPVPSAITPNHGSTNSLLRVRAVDS